MARNAHNPSDASDLPLFDRARARRTDPATSHAAAARANKTGLRVTTKARVLGHLQKLGWYGATSHEIAVALNLSLVTVSPVMKPLERDGAVQRTAERRNGRTVWTVPAQEEDGGKD